MKCVAKLSFMYMHITSVPYATKNSMDTTVIRIDQNTTEL